MPNAARRKFLKESLLGFVALSAGPFLPFADESVEITEEIRLGLRFFSPHEYRVMSAVASRIVGEPRDNGMSGGELDIALRADEFLSGADPEIQEQYHQLLAVFDSALFAFLFNLRLSSFLGMSPADQSTYLAGWMDSRLAFRRTAFQALKRMSLSIFYADPRSWKEIGYDGMFLPEARR